MTYSPDLTTAAVKMAVALVLVLVMVWAVYRIARKAIPAARGAGGGRNIRIIENQYIGIKKNILMVQVPGALLVLGVTADKIHLLTRLDDPDVIKGLSVGNARDTLDDSSFTAQLQRFLGAKRAVRHNVQQTHIAE